MYNIVFCLFFLIHLFFFSKNLIMMLTNYTVVKSSQFFFKIQKVNLYFNHSGFWFYHFVFLRQETNCFVLHFHSPSRCTFFRNDSTVTVLFPYTRNFLSLCVTSARCINVYTVTVLYPEARNFVPHCFCPPIARWINWVDCDCLNYLHAQEILPGTTSVP